MRKLNFAVRMAMLLLLFTSIGVGQSMARPADDKEVTVEGEIVNVYCYMSRHHGSGKGSEHASCANSCIRKGGVVGFVSEDGDFYLLLNSNSTPLRTKVAGLAGRKVKVTGNKIDRDDTDAIVVRTIARVRATS